MNDYAWIGFPYALDAEEFMNAVAGDYSTELHPIYNRISQRSFGADDRAIALWRYSSRPWDTSILGEDGDDFDGPEHRQFVFSFCIEFPNSDIPLLTERMMQFNTTERGSAYREEREVA